MCWHYSDEISTAAVSLYDWILSFRPGRPDNNAGNGNNPGAINPVNNPPNVEPETPIELIDNVGKGKSKLLSPSASFESLKNRAEQTGGGF